MCGIFGIVTDRESDIGDILVEAGKRLAYRGYDSVGSAVVGADGAIDLRKDVGKIDAVSEALGMRRMRGLRGIAQLRWATFGAPSRANAQPHLDCDGDLVGAHNGNVVNHVMLRRRFVEAGHTVRGDNDGESCVHAVEAHLDAGAEMVEAIRRAYADLDGDYAFVITGRGENVLYAIKKGSGLVAGIGDGFTCVSSDLPSLLPLTRDIVRLQDGEIVVLRPGGVEVRRVDTGAVVAREVEAYAGAMDAAEKGGYAHFMLKEIHEQPKVAAELLHLLRDSADVHRVVDIMRSADRLYFVGCGTSYHACLLGAYYWNQIAGRLAIPMLPGQFIEQASASLDPRAAVLFVSQSGETKDVLSALNVARDKAVRLLGMCNVIGSTLMHVTEAYLPLACGYEISVPATKTFMNQALLFHYLARAVAGKDVAALDAVPDLLERAIAETEAPAEAVARRLAGWDSLYYLGYGLTEAIALEGALKLKEITYAHCEGMFSSEFKHGPLSAVFDGFPVVFFTAPGDEAMMTNHVHEVTCRGGHAIAVAEDHAEFRQNVGAYLAVPRSNRMLFPLLATVPAQLVAYHMSLARGLDPDFPRNLSKTLTVD